MRIENHMVNLNGMLKIIKDERYSIVKITTTKKEWYIDVMTNRKWRK